MSFLPKILAPARRDGDPTAEWPLLSPALPKVFLDKPAIGRLTFGAPLDEARYLGKPDSCRWTQPGYLELVYAKAGFQVDFENDRMAYGAFFVGPDSSAPRNDDLKYCCPEVEGGSRFSATTTQADLVTALGEPDSVDDLDDDEIIVNFFAKGVVLEFELNAAGCLKRWNLYPEEEPSA